jgi:hypothetical protein
MALLDALDAVDWSRYRHAYGPATDVPGLLRALAHDEAASEELRAHAASRGKHVFDTVTRILWGNVYHQGSVWGVTAKVVPFLVELLDADLSAPKREFLLMYLHAIARGCPDVVFPQAFDLDEVEYQCRRVTALNLPASVIDGDAWGELPSGLDRETARQARWIWERDCFVAVEAAVPAVLRRVHDPEDDVVDAALSFLASFPRRASESVPVLWALARGGDTPRAARALLALAVLREDVGDRARELHDAVGDRHVGSLYAAAAEVLATRGAPTPAWAVERLLHPVDDWRLLPCAFAAAVDELCHRMLLCLPDDARAEVIEAVGRSLATQSGVGEPDAFETLLIFAHATDLTSLNPLQRRAIALIAEHGDWPEGTVNGDQTASLRYHGLPTRREELVALAQPCGD